jgi:hypothetical protein
LGPLNKGAPVQPTADNVTIARLTQLADLTGVQLPTLTEFAPAPSDKSDTDLVIDFLQGLSEAVPGAADAAARRLGTTQLIELVRTTKRSQRSHAYAFALDANWIPADLVTISAIAHNDVEAVEHLATLLVNGACDPDLTAEDITTWVLGRDVGPRAVRGLWDTRNFPQGLVTYATAQRYSSRAPEVPSGYGPRVSRITANDALQLASGDENRIAFAATYVDKPTTALLVELFDLATAANPADHGIHYGAIVARMLELPKINPAVVNCLRRYITSGAGRTNYLGFQSARRVLDTKHLSSSELIALIRCFVDSLDTKLIVEYIGGQFAKNQPTRATADKLASRINPAGVWQVLSEYESHHPFSPGSQVPDVFDALVTPLRDSPVAPVFLIQELTTNTGQAIGYPVVVQLAFKAAARAFAVANPTVQTRLWRALATQQSIVRHSKLSLDELTELYIVRDEEPAERLASKAVA